MERKKIMLIVVGIILLLVVIAYPGISRTNKSNNKNKSNIEDNSNKSQSKNQNPVIELKGLNSNSSGDFVTTVDLNSEFVDDTYKATSSSGTDLTDRVIVNIMYDNRAVEKVDTSKIGIYYIKYTVVDDNGKSTTVTRNVIISDISAPVLNLPKDNKISKDVKEFDLKKGVTCTDNSNSCDIDINGTIDFGVSGKYIIEYVATDPSGNTSTLKRVITVE